MCQTEVAGSFPSLISTAASLLISLFMHELTPNSGGVCKRTIRTLRIKFRDVEPCYSVCWDCSSFPLHHMCFNSWKATQPRCSLKLVKFLVYSSRCFQLLFQLLFYRISAYIWLLTKTKVKTIEYFLFSFFCFFFSFFFSECRQKTKSVCHEAWEILDTSYGSLKTTCWFTILSEVASFNLSKYYDTEMEYLEFNASEGRNTKLKW